MSTRFLSLVLLFAVLPPVAHGTPAEEKEDPHARFTEPLYGKDVEASLKSLDALLRKELGSESVRAALEHAVVKARDWRVRSAALRCLAFQDTAEKPTVIVKYRRDKLWQIRLGVAEALPAYRHLFSVDALIDLLEDERLRIRSTAASSLFRLTLRDFGVSAERWKKWRKEEGDGFVLPRPEQRPKARDPRHAREYAQEWFKLKVTSDRVVFLLDKSESMLNGLFEAVVAELKGFLEASGSKAKFTVVSFGDTPSAWRKKLMSASHGNITHVLAFLNQSKPVGATNIMDSLDLAFAVDDADTFVLLSDGLPNRGRITETGAIRDEVRRLNRYRRIAIHTVLLVRGRKFPHDGPRGDAKPPLDARERAMLKKRRGQLHLSPQAGFLRELAKRNEGEFDFAFADWYDHPPGAVLRPGTDR